jgi:hypothetical protein
VFRARLRFEQLETRDCPSASWVGSILGGHLAQAAHTGAVNGNAVAAPVIVDFTATEDYGCTWTFAGNVSDPNMAGMHVALGGLQSLAGQTVTVAADGSFSLTIMLQPGESGTATAQATDCNGQVSNVATAFVQQTFNWQHQHSGGGGF